MKKKKVPRRVLVVGDIHGRYDQFMWLMSLLNFSPNDDALIVLGDLIDRGYKSKDVIEWFQPGHPGQNAKVIRGNHEDIFLGYLAGKYVDNYYLNTFIGGQKTIDSYADADTELIDRHIKFLNELPYYFEHGNYTFVHAGLDVNRPLEHQTIDDLIYDNSEFLDKPVTSHYQSKIVIFGHTPTEIIRDKLDLPQIGSYIYYDLERRRIGLDCGNKSAKRLACLDLTNGIEYYQGMKRKDQEITEMTKTLKRQKLLPVT